MIRGALRLAIVGAGISYALDRILSEQSKGQPPEPIESMVVVDAPIEKVWEAWTSPEHLEAWWGPGGFRTTTSRFDLTVGGQWAHTMHGPDGVAGLEHVRGGGVAERVTARPLDGSGGPPRRRDRARDPRRVQVVACPRRRARVR